MTKIIQHLQFLALMLPTLMILAAAAVSMADLALPSAHAPYAVAAILPYDAVWHEHAGE